jgi:hypothetical protein
MPQKASGGLWRALEPLRITYPPPALSKATENVIMDWLFGPQQAPHTLGFGAASELIRHEITGG